MAKARRLPPDPDVEAFFTRGVVRRPYAVERRDRGERVPVLSLDAGVEIVGPDSGDDSGIKAALVGAPVGSHQVVIGQTPAGEPIYSRLLERAVPVEWGPWTRMEVRVTCPGCGAQEELQPTCLECSGRGWQKRVVEGRRSALLRAYPDAQRKRHLARLGITGGEVPRHLFRLAGGEVSR